MCCVVLRAPEGGSHTAWRRGFQGKGGGVGVVLGKRVNGKGSQRRGEEQGIEASGGSIQGDGKSQYPAPPPQVCEK